MTKKGRRSVVHGEASDLLFDRVESTVNCEANVSSDFFRSDLDGSAVL